MTKLQGVFTALITPFDRQGQLDEEGLRHLIKIQIEQGADGIVVLGTTGESPTLSHEEKIKVIDIARQETKHRIVLGVGTGSYSTNQTIDNTRQAEEMGADMALVITPYYNKPTQEGLYRHFKTISESVKIPIIIYNNHGRTGQNLQTETLKKLAEIPSIIGVKESSGNISQVSDVIESLRKVRPDFSIMNGDDMITLACMALGAHGVISCLGNILLSEIKALVETALAGKFDLAREMHFHLIPLIRTLFIETNPIAIKAAMHLCGLPAGECRLPLCSLSAEHAAQLERIIPQYLDISAPSFI